MRRLLLALLSGILLTAAAPVPVPVRLSPPQPTLGIPLLVTVELPDAATELAGIPALAPFELLTPPRREGKELRLVLLPMRPGRHALPPFPLHRGRSEQLATAPLTVEVAEGIPDDAEAAALKALPTPGAGPYPWLGTLLVGLLAATAVLLRRRRKAERNRQPPPLEELGGEALLAELQRRLDAINRGGDKPWQALARRLERLRFAPGKRSEEAVRQLLADFRELAGEEP